MSFTLYRFIILTFWIFQTVIFGLLNWIADVAFLSPLAIVWNLFIKVLWKFALLSKLILPRTLLHQDMVVFLPCLLARWYKFTAEFTEIHFLNAQNINYRKVYAQQYSEITLQSLKAQDEFVLYAVSHSAKWKIA